MVLQIRPKNYGKNANFRIRNVADTKFFETIIIKLRKIIFNNNGHFNDINETWDTIFFLHHKI